MAVELIVTELFKRGNTHFPKGTTIRDAETMAWATKNHPTHVMRKFYVEPPVAAPVVAQSAPPPTPPATAEPAPDADKRAK